MKANRLNQWLALAANLGVLVGIMLLVYELNQNQEFMRAQTRHQLAMGFVEFSLNIALNEHLADIVVRAHGEGQLTPTEDTQYLNLSVATLLFWQSFHYQYRTGLIDEVSFNNQVGMLHGLLGSGGPTIAIYCNLRENLSPEFVIFVNGLFEDNPC